MARPNKAIDWCTVEGCGFPHQAKGYCQNHYRSFKDRGDPLAAKRRKTATGEPLDYLTNVACLYDGDDCLKWPYATGSNGYGRIRFEGMDQMPHRLVCMFVYGPPPEGTEAAHSCGKGHEGCVNPNHLRWDTKLSNNQDKFVHGTAARKLSPDHVRAIRVMEPLMSQDRIAELTGVSQSTVSAILRRSIWGWLD